MDTNVQMDMEFEFSKPAKKKAKGTVERVQVDVMAQAVRYRELHEQFNSIKAEMETIKTDMVDAVLSRRDAMLREGESDPKLESEAGDGHKIQFNFKDMYRPRERGADLAKLKAFFGPEFPVLVEETEKLTFRDGITTKSLITALGDEGYLRLRPYIDVSEGYAPRKGAVAEVARLFREGKARVAEVFLKLINSTTDKPSVVVR